MPAMTQVLERPDEILPLLEREPLRYLELIEQLRRAPETPLSLYVDDLEAPANLAAVRWGGGALSLFNLVDIFPGRISGLFELLEALPRAQGSYEFFCPFWVAPALEQAFRTELQGPVARYRLDPAHLAPEPAARQSAKLTTAFDDEDLGLLPFAFPHTVAGAPHRGLVLKGELVAVAAVTAQVAPYAALSVHVPAEHRGRGFGAGALLAAAEALLAQGLTPTTRVSLGDEASVRRVEALGMTVHETVMKVNGVGRRVQ